MRKFLSFLLTSVLLTSGFAVTAQADDSTPRVTKQQQDVLGFVAEPGNRSQLILTAPARSWILRNTIQNPRRIGETDLYVVRVKDAKAEAMIAELPSASVFPDRINYLSEPIVLSENISPKIVSGVDTVGMIGADTVHSDGVTGEGVAVAILDTGIDPDHPYFKDAQGNSRIVQEACFVGVGWYVADPVENFPCLNGQSSQIGLGASDITNHPSSPQPNNMTDINTTWTPNVMSTQDWADNMSHGTHVAGLAAGASNTLVSIPDTVPGGIAPDADIISIRIFGLNAGWSWDSFYEEWYWSPGGAYDSDIIAAVNWVTDNAATYNIAALNLSLGGGEYSSFCGGTIETAFSNARAAGVAPMVATGNESFNNAVSWPACASSAIAVGSVDGNGGTSYFSNTGPQIDILAPGADVGSAVPRADQVYTNGYERWYGTSMATPVAAGAVALIKSAHPDATITEIENALESTGTLVDDEIVKDIPRINVDLAIAEFGPALLAQTITVTGATSAKIDETKSITASATSGLNVTATITTGSVCSVDSTSFSAGTRTITVSFSSASECEISFAQAGDATYAAVNTTHSIQVTKYSQTITYTAPDEGQIGGSGEIRASASSGLIPVATRNGLDSGKCTLSSSVEGSTLVVNVQYIGLGGCTISIAQSGNATYLAASPKTFDIDISKASQTISVTTPTDFKFGLAATLAPTASSELSVTIESDSPAICTVSGFVVSPIGIGDCVLRFSQSGNGSYFAASDVVRTVPVGYQTILKPILLSPNKSFKAITLRWKVPTNATFAGLVKYKVKYRVAYPGKTFSAWLTRYTTNRTLKVLLKQSKYRIEYRVSAIAAISVSSAVSGKAQVK